MNSQVAPQTVKRPWYFAVIVLAFVPFAGIGVDLYSPSLPWIQRAMHVDPALIKLTISVYLLGYAIGPLFFGLLADIHGRKKILFGGLILYIFSCIGIVAFPNIQMMLGMRLLQGFAIGAAGVTSKAMIIDTYKGEAMRKMGSMMAIIWAIGPVIAPFIGGYLQHYYGWHANFYFLMGYAVIILFASFSLPETLTNKIEMSKAVILHSYKTVLLSKPFWAGVIYMGVVYSIITIFNTVGPFFIQNVLHYSPIQFGHIALVMGLAFLFRGLLNRVLVNFLKVRTLLIMGLSLMFIGSLIFLFVDYQFPPNLYLFTIPVFMILFFSSFVFPIGMSKCLGMFPEMAGIANSVMSFLFVTFTAITTAFASFLTAHTALPMAGAYIGLILLCGVGYSLMGKCPRK